MVKDELEMKMKSSGVLLREAGDLKLSNRSFKASVGLGCSAA